MSRKQNVTVVSNTIFSISFAFYLIFNLTKLTFLYEYYVNISKYISLVNLIPLLYVEMFEGRYINKREFSGLLICITGVGIVLFSSSESIITMTSMLIYLYCSRKRSFEIIINIAFKCTLVVLLNTIILAKIGIITNYVMRSTDGVGGTRVREFLGFRYALYPAVLGMMVVFDYIYLHREKLKFVNILTLFVMEFYIFKATDSRLAFATSVMLLIFSLIIKNKEMDSKSINILKLLLSNSYIISCIISFALVYMYAKGNYYAIQLNKTLGNRLLYSLISLQKYGIGLTGKDVEWIGAGLNVEGLRNQGIYLYVDNIYIHMLQQNGIIYTLTYILLNTALLYKMKDGDKYIFAILCLLAFYGLIDDQIRYIAINPFLFLIPINFFNKEEQCTEQ